MKEKTYVYIGDVTGHGAAAGLIMTMVNSLMTVFVDIYDSPYQILVNINKYVKKYVKKAMFMTGLFLSWDENEKKMTYVGCGHEHMIIYRKKTGECEVLMSGGVALGMVPDNSKLIKESSLDFGDGDFIVLYSDGITEARDRNGEMFGLERLKEVVVEYAGRYSADGVNYHIAKDVSAFIEGTSQADDMTLIVIKRDDSVSGEEKDEDEVTDWDVS